MKSPHGAIVLAAALALPALAADDTRKPFDVTLEPGKSHEECMALDKGAARKWHWKADGPMDFNIHYHEGDKVTYPVKRSAMRGDGGTFTAKVAQDYCWMWTAKGPKAAKVTGSID